MKKKVFKSGGGGMYILVGARTIVLGHFWGILQQERDGFAATSYSAHSATTSTPETAAARNAARHCSQIQAKCSLLLYYSLVIAAVVGRLVP